MTETETTRGERVEWLELFFDLVVVAAVAVLTEGLREEPTAEGLGLFLLLYAGIWFSWVSVVLYANVAGTATRTCTVIAAMFLVAVMAATAPIHFEQRANAFAVGFILLRAVVARSAVRTGRMLQGWPLLQFGGATGAWLAAMWFDPPAKYLIWAAALGLDVAFVLLRGDHVDEDQLRRIRRELAEEERRGLRRGARGRPVTHVELTTVRAEPEHLAERLGLFVIIVLGEAVSQLVVVGSTQLWTPALIALAVAAFALLVGLWGLTFSYGFVGAPHSRMAVLQPRFGLPLHLLTTVGIVTLAAGMGEMMSHPDQPLTTLLRWVMCLGLSLYYLVMGVAGWSGGAPLRWVLGWALPCTVLPVVLAAAAVDTRLGDVVTLWLLVATIVWMNLYGRFHGTRVGQVTEE